MMLRPRPLTEGGATPRPQRLGTTLQPRTDGAPGMKPTLHAGLAATLLGLASLLAQAAPTAAPG